MNCPKCGSPVREDYDFCVACGYRVRGNVQKPPVKKPPEMKTATKTAPKKFKWQYAVIALLLIAVGFLVYRIVSGNRVNVDPQIEQINVLYADVQNALNANELEKIERDGVYYHFDEAGDLRLIYAPAGARGLAYSRMIYYYNDQPFFAYYELDDSHSLYIDNGELIRWRYCPDKNDAANGTNLDMERDNDDFLSMEAQVLNEAYSYLQ